MVIKSLSQLADFITLQILFLHHLFAFTSVTLLARLFAVIPRVSNTDCADLSQKSAQVVFWHQLQQYQTPRPNNLPMHDKIYGGGEKKVYLLAKRLELLSHILGILMAQSY